LRDGFRTLASATACVAAIGASVAGCGAASISESSTCRQFLAASPQDQQTLVSQLAGKYQKPDYATPLGQPEVPYYCASHPDMTLKQFFEVATG